MTEATARGWSVPMAIVGVFGLVTAGWGFLDGVATDAEKSIASCQQATLKAKQKLEQATTKAILGCLSPGVKDYFAGEDISSITLHKCTSALRQVSDSRELGKSAPEKFAAQVAKACEPGPSNEHTLADVLGPGATVGQPLHAAKLGPALAGAGGPPVVDSVSTYSKALVAVTEAKTAEHIGKAIPESPKILKRIAEKVEELPVDPNDPTRKADLKKAVDSVKNRIDSDGDDEIDPEPTSTTSTSTSTTSTVTTSTTTTTIFVPNVCGNCVWEPGAGEGCDPCAPTAGPGCLPNCTCDGFSICNFF